MPYIINLSTYKKALCRAFLFITPIVISISYLWGTQSPLVASANNEVYFLLTFGLTILYFSFKSYISLRKLLLVIIVSLLLLFITLATQTNTSKSLLFFTYYLGFCFTLHISENIKNREKYLLSTIIHRTFIIASIACFFIVIYQFLGFANFNPEDMFSNLWIHPSDGFRPSANLAQPNNLGTLFCLAICAAYALEKDKNKRFLLIIIFGFGIFATASRTALLSILVVCFFLHRKNSFKDAYRPVGWVLFLYLFDFVISSLLEVPQKRSIDANSGRYLIWRMSIDAILQSPLIGHGPLNITRAFFIPISQNSSFSENSILSSAHNIYLDIFIQFGIIGLSTAMIFTFSIINKLSTHCKSHVYSARLTCIPIFIHALLEFPLNYLFFLLPFASLIGISIKTQYEEQFKFRPHVISLIVITLAITVVYDYYKAEFYYKKSRLQFNNYLIPAPLTGNEECLISHYCNLAKAILVINNKKRTVEDDSLILDAARDFPSPALYKERIIIIQDRKQDASKDINYYCNTYKKTNTEICSTKMEH